MFVAENWPILADEVWSILAMATKPDGALHVPFHRQVDIVTAETLHFQFPCDEAHHDLRTADHCDRTGRLQSAVLEQRRDYADVAPPAQATIVDRDQYLSLAVASPCPQFLAIQQVARAACTVEDHQSPIVSSILQDLIDQRSQRRQADPASHHDDVPPARCLHWPACPKRTSHTHRVAHSPVHQRMSGLPD